MDYFRNNPTKNAQGSEELERALEQARGRGSREDFARLLEQLKALGPDAIKRVLSENPQIAQTLAGAMGSTRAA
jgi:hypothetical protein